MPDLMTGNVNSGPIPGAAMTSDTSSQPWHQPPKFTDIDSAMDMLSKKLLKFKSANECLNMIENGLPVVKVSQLILMQGVSEGFWSIDIALLLCGPLTRMLELICMGFKVDYDLGLTEDDSFVTGNFFKNQQKLKAPEGYTLIKEELPNVMDAADSQQGGTGASTGTGNPISLDTAAAGGQNEQPLQQGGFMAMTAKPPAGGADKGAPAQ